MEAGDIVTEKEKGCCPDHLEGTPDGKAFYKVSREIKPGHLHIHLFYIGWWRLEDVRKQGRMFNDQIVVEEKNLRLATEEEKAQLALAMFME